MYCCMNNQANSDGTGYFKFNVLKILKHTSNDSIKESNLYNDLSKYTKNPVKFSMHSPSTIKKGCTVSELI